MTHHNSQTADGPEEDAIDRLIAALDPTSWQGHGVAPGDMTREQRGAAFGSRRRALAALDELIASQEPQASPEADPEGSEELEEEIARDEAAAAALLDRISARSKA